MTWLSRAEGARTLVLSFRKQSAGAGRTHLFELEDLLAGPAEGADLLAVERPLAPSALVRARGRLERLVPRLGPIGWPGRAPLERDYDLLVVACQDPSDLYRLGPLEPWRRRCARAVCLVNEVWLHELERRRGELQLLRRFDRLLTSCRASVAALAQATGRPAGWLAPAVDALRFRPPPDARAGRRIDVYSLGRRDPALHEALLAEAARRRWFYLYSTTTRQQVPDPAAHRERLAALVQRSRYFVVSPARAGDPALRQQEVGTRYVEGAAGGATLVGSAPTDDGGLLDWPDAVRPLPAGPGLAAALDELEAEPERLERARRAGVVGVLRRHDWAHRWSDLLGSVGLPPAAGLRARLERLAEAEAEERAAARGPAQLV